MQMILSHSMGFLFIQLFFYLCKVFFNFLRHHLSIIGLDFWGNGV